MTALQSFIHSRMRELANEDAALRHKLSVNESERAQLRAAAQAAGLQLEPTTQPVPPPAVVEAIKTGDMSKVPPSLIGGSRRTIPEKSIKEAVLEVLDSLGIGLTALDLLGAINTKFNTDYPRTSLSPQLSRLKAEGKITRDGNLWSLAKPPLVELPGWAGVEPETNEPAHPTSEGTNERAQFPVTNSATVEPVEEVAHDNMKTPNVFG